MDRKSAWAKYDSSDIAMIDSFCEGYKSYLDMGKTERECVEISVRMAEQEGYVSIEDFAASGKGLYPGAKIYAVNMNKTIALFHIGNRPLTEGMNILGAHIDSPRVDVKSNPMYESDGLLYLDTHYYGGIKKYHWVNMPLSLHGVVVTKDSRTVKINIGEDEGDPVFVFTDLIAHLSAEQQAKPANKVIPGEGLDLLIGNRPIDEMLPGGDDKEAVKANVLRIIRKKYGFGEEDFLSAELEIVPAGKARDCGLDRSMILAYGQDDRICAFTSLMAILDEKDPSDKTSCCLLVDKEEIGSRGATGMTSMFFENTVSKLLKAAGETDIYMASRETLANCRMLSSDVSAAYDPLYPEAFEKKNAALLGMGMCFNKYTGSRGKSGSNDANPEFIADIRRILDNADVSYQFSELGRVDVGGGGTIAYIMAVYGMEVIDSGVAVLSMHAPYEVSSKVDIFETYCGYRAFLVNA